MIPSTYQEAIWDQFRSGNQHLVVRALAGSGKTTTMIHGLDHLPYGQVLLTSFGKDITDELAKRVPYGAGARVKTLHGLGMSALMRHIRPTNKDPDKYKTHDHVRRILRQSGISATRPVVSAVAHLVEWCKHTMASSLEDIQALQHKLDVNIPIKGSEPQTVKELKSAEYLEDSVTCQLVMDVLMACAEDLSRFDYNDMIWLPLVRGLPFEQYDTVLVDECQDMNFAQIQLVRQLCAPGGRIIAVGDENQSIYQFRGADHQAMQRIVDGLDARTLPLSVTYRCAEKIVDEANKFVPELEPAPNAPAGIFERINLEEFWQMVDPGDFVLSRANAPLAAIGSELKMKGLPVVQLGRDVGRDLIDTIRRSRKRTVDDLRDWLDEYEAIKAEKLKADGKEEALQAIQDKTRSIRNYTLGFNTTAEVIQHIEHMYSDKPTGNQVVLSTVHKAKGKEANRVFMLDETFLRRRTQEEKNIAYVAITRAKSELYYVEGNVYAL